MGRDKIKIDILIHDLKVPLAVIEAGVSSLIKRPEKYGSLTEKQKTVLQRVLRNTKTTQALVNDVLELGKSAQGILNLTSCRLSSLIAQTFVEIFDLTESDTSDNVRNCPNLALLKELLKSQGILLSVDETLWYEEIFLDEPKIKQILRNLLSNGLKYRKALLELAIEKECGYFVISVKDDGEGIPPLYHKKIFECYFQMDANEICSVRGHGLGLAGVMVLVEDMEGKLTLESEQGKGARFIVKLPLRNR
ncbi:MAG: sensor histidine kinase [Deltaproteobacteria bacterium]|nr:sensor histidine kinase [Deltaproteobacteria bacterium]